MQNIPQRQAVSESEVTATSTSLLTTFSAAQRTFGVPRFPEHISIIEGADFIFQSVLQKINVNGIFLKTELALNKRVKGEHFTLLWLNFVKWKRIKNGINTYTVQTLVMRSIKNGREN